MDNEPATPEAESSATLRQRWGDLVLRAKGLPGWARQNGLKASLWGSGVVALALLMCTGAWILLTAGRTGNVGHTLDQALAELDAGNYIAAKEMVQQLQNSDALAPNEWGGPAFVLGAATAYDVQTSWDTGEDHTATFLLAARYLEEARDRGFPRGRRGEGLFLLGKSLHDSRQYVQAAPVLIEAIEASPQDSGEIYDLLSRAYLFQSRPQLQSALDYNAKYLEYIETNAGSEPSDEKQYAALLVRGQILFQQRDLDASQKALDRIPLKAKHRAEAILIRGRILVYEGDQLIATAKPADAAARRQDAVEKYNDAVSQFKRAADLDTLGSVATRKSAYMIGVVHSKLEDYRAAREQFSRTHKLYRDTPEALAAGLEEAGMLRQLSQDDEAVRAYRRTLREAGRPSRYDNHWIRLDGFRRRVEQAYAHYLGQERYDLAIQITSAMTPIFSRPRATQFEAEARRAWADSLSRKAAALRRSEAEETQKQARRQFRLAGLTFARLAKHHITSKQYADDVWQSADNFLQGRDYQKAVRMLRKYLEDQTRRRRPQALVALGESLLALDKIDESVKAFNECIQFFPKAPAAYQARLIGSRAHLEQGNIEQAKQLLLDNLHNEALTPRSPEWRESLFALGMLYHAEGRLLATKSRAARAATLNAQAVAAGMADLEKSNSAYRKAVRHLSEAVERYTTSPQAMEAQYLIAESQRSSANLPQVKLATVTIETTRVALIKEIRAALDASLTTYRQLQQRLNRRSEQEELTPKEKAILRNCYFAQGAALFDLADYENAIVAYSSATNRYQRDPTALEAYVQIASCHRRLNRPVDARGTLAQAIVVLDRIDRDADFATTTRFRDRDDWRKLLIWLSNLDS